MATAVQSMTATEQAQANVDQTRKAAAAVNAELSDYRDRLGKLEQEQANVQAQHDRDCRALASGQGVDPSISKSALDAIAFKISGTRSHVDELTPKADALNEAVYDAELVYAHKQHLDRLTVKLERETAKKAAGLAKVEEGAAAMREHGESVFEVGAERKLGAQIEKEMRERKEARRQ
jgi:hypothetical protein